MSVEFWLRVIVISFPIPHNTYSSNATGDFGTFLDELDLSGNELWLLNSDYWHDGWTSQIGDDWKASSYNYPETPTTTGNDNLSLDYPTIPLRDNLHEALSPAPQGPHNQSTPDSSGSSLTPLVSTPVTPISSVGTTVCLAKVAHNTIFFEPQAGLPSVHATSPATGDVLTSQSSDLVDCTRYPKQFSGTDKLSEHSTLAHPTPRYQYAYDICTTKIGGECNLTTSVAPYRCRYSLQSLQK